MLSNLNPNTFSYHYEPYPSFFTLAEIPIRKLHDSQNFRGEISLPNLLMRVVVYPLTLCAAALTMLADIILGLAEISFAYYKGCNETVLKSIALKKIIASPIQHLTFIAINATGCCISALYISLIYKISFISCLPFSGFLTLVTYPISQKAIGALPKWARPDGFYIFIDGGANDLDGSKYTQQFDKMYQQYKQERTQKRSNLNVTKDDWDGVCEKIIKEFSLKEIKKENDSELTGYEQFKNGIIKKIKPQKLLNLNDNFTEKELRSSFKKYSLLLHPDRNPNRIDESNALTKCFFEAHALLQEELNKKA